MIDSHIHKLLCVIGVLVIVSLGVESIFTNSSLVALMTPMMTTFLGVWYVQVGYILWAPLDGGQGWFGDDHYLVMLSLVLFVFHFWTVFIITVFIIPLIGRGRNDKPFTYIGF